MKTVLFTLIALFIAVSLSAVTDVINFNDTSNLTDLFNSGSSPAFTNTSDGGLNNTGSVNIPMPSYDIWTHKTGFAVPEVGQTATISAYYKITGNNGYSGLGFATANQNELINNQVTNSSSLGMAFHGGGGFFFNNTAYTSVNWYLVSGDLVIGNWYRVTFTATNQGSNVFDLEYQIWNSDSAGTLGTLFTIQSQNGVTNSNIGGASTIYPYFANSGSRSGKIDNLYVEITEPAPTAVFSDGDGTLVDPYVITTPDQLNDVRYFLDSNFILGNDIDLDVSPYNTGTGWVPIGVCPSTYTVLDLSLATGGSFTITGRDMTGDYEYTTDPIFIPTDIETISDAVMFAGFSASVGDLGNNKFSVSNYIRLNLELVEGIVDTYEDGTYPFSGVFNGNGKTIANLYIQPSIFHVGLFGFTVGATLSNITLSGVHVDGTAYAGSLIGWGEDTAMSNCHSNGSVSANAYCGGLAGNITGSVHTVLANCSFTGTVSGSAMIGGLFGYCNNYTLNGCYSISNVSGNNGSIGGLIGFSSSTNLNNCFTRGAVSGGNGARNGGLLGNTNFCYITNSYSASTVNSTNANTGGLFGLAASYAATGCYWDTIVSGRTNASGNVGGATATACNTDDMTYPYNAFVGWDFATIWKEDTFNLNAGYPFLRSPDYLNGMDETEGDVIITVTGGDAYIGSGYIPETTSLAFLPNQTFTFVGTGTLTISIATDAQYGAYWLSGAWNTVPNTAGQVTFMIDFDLLGKGEVAVVLGDEDQTLPVELSSFTAITTQQNYVQLNWVTQSESGLSGYYIYRSNTNNLYNAQIVSGLISAYNSSQQHAYTYTDREVQPGSWYYWLQNLELDGQIGFHGSIHVEIQETGDGGTPEIPLITSLQKVYPNPFNPSTTIAFGLAKAENVNIQIFNVKGQLIRNLVSGIKQADSYRIVWNGTDDIGRTLSSGIYYARMTAGDYSSTQKLVIMK